VQGLDPTSSIQGNGEIGDVLDVQAGLAQQFRRAAGGEDPPRLAASSLENSMIPVLSETLISAG